MPALTIEGAAGSTNEIEYLDALGGTNRWQSLTNVALIGASASVVDSACYPSLTHRFYRARWSAARVATATASVVNGFLVAITVVDGGAGYVTPPTVTITGGGGTAATATASVAAGAVAQIVVSNAGHDYASTPTVAVGPPPGAASLLMTTSKLRTLAVKPPVPNPDEQVSWIDATNYCAKLTERERAAGRLPSSVK